MDRFFWSDDKLYVEEQLLIIQKGVKMYNGPNKTAYDKGRLTLTTHRLIWANAGKSSSVLSLLLSYSVFIEKEAGGITSSPKIRIHLSDKDENQPSGPFSQSSFSYIQLSFTDGGHDEFFKRLNEAISDRKWERIPSLPANLSSKSFHTGIAGIERSLQIKKHDRDATISVAFEDLSNLMKKAQEMVNLSKSISAKLLDKLGSMSEDETFQFKSYLMSLGIKDPITRETHGTGGAYYEGLASEISQFIKEPLVDCGGVMPLTDAYCRINRARGLELISPEDLELACRLLDKMNLPVRMKSYENGVKVLQLHSCDEKVVAEETEKMVKEKGHLSAEELATLVGLSVLLAKQRLFTAESLGKLCRDESYEGLSFYPNLFQIKN